MTENNILGKEKAEELKKLLYKGKMSPQDALKKVQPRKEVKPIDDAWDYLVKERMIVFGDEDKRDYKKQKKNTNCFICLLHRQN